MMKNESYCPLITYSNNMVGYAFVMRNSFFVLLNTTTLFISLLQKGRKEMAREIGKMTFEKIDHKAVNYRRLC